GDFDGALDLAQKQLARNPTYAVPLGHMGLAYFGKNNLGAAAEAFKKAISMEPEYTPLRHWLGSVYRLQGEYQPAIEILLTIPKINATDLSAYYDVGVVYRLAGNDERARQSFLYVQQELQKLLAGSPNNVELMFGMASVLIQKGETQRGRSIADAAIRLDPRRHLEYARMLSLQGKTEDALRRLEVAINEGFHDYISLITHPDLHSLHSDPRFRSLVEKKLHTR